MSYQHTKHTRRLPALPEASSKLIGSSFSKTQMEALLWKIEHFKRARIETEQQTPHLV